MKLEEGKRYRSRRGDKWHVDWVGNGWASGHTAEEMVACWHIGGNCHSGISSEHDLISEWREPTAAGSCAWANSLPVGTKVRWHNWDKHEHAIRELNGWHLSHAHLDPPGTYNHASGWLLYTEPKLRPWHYSEVPLGAWARNTDHKGTVVLITGSGPLGIAIGQKGDFQPAELLSYFEHSTDGGKTWLQCGSKE